MWKPKKDLLVPIKTVIDISNPKSHMHRTVAKPLLKIIFRNEKGEINSAAWYVKKLNLWKNILNKLISKNK